MLLRTAIAGTALLLGAVTLLQGAQAETAAEKALVDRSVAMTPGGPWPAGDQVGMANTLGPGTWLRCAAEMSADGAKSYELSHVRSNDMPMSPFGVPLKYEYRPTVGIPGTKHAFNGEQVLSGEPGAQGTQLDALGHFAYLGEAWSGEGDFPADAATYYGGYKQAEVKPDPAGPLLKLGVENVPPIVTTAVLLDAQAFIGGGKALEPGQIVSRADIETMLEAEGLAWRGILPGDVVLIHTGWGERWDDAEKAKDYYFMGPGLGFDAAEYLAERKAVLVSLDNPFTDPVAAGQLQGKANAPQKGDEGLPFAIHHQNLAVNGLHQIQNARLGALAADKVWTSCVMILPLRSEGASGSPVRPVAIGAPKG
ncbi:cyclase family protein [Oceanibacterium hippocampi]|uniref:Putative cyclase n=1 Tax=Oceanibacterium hippocampi TaxID=745714 RepID=A0A1Y5SX94_9PROT|nr:cyclase family protein [Oceanibacterium hippocampi]SLN50225.1 Putative cyclase [Oceanibacterium hippocampi]